MSVIVKMQKENDEDLDIDLKGEDEEILVLTKGSDDVVLNDLDVGKSPDLPDV